MTAALCYALVKSGELVTACAQRVARATRHLWAVTCRGCLSRLAAPTKVPLPLVNTIPNVWAGDAEVRDRAFEDAARVHQSLRLLHDGVHVFDFTRSE